MKIRSKKPKIIHSKIGLSLNSKVVEGAYAAAAGTSRTLSGFFEYAVKKEIEIYEQSIKKEIQ